ncbi:hypothetical protein ACQ4PT_068377 [Festuca glaucescens]
MKFPSPKPLSFALARDFLLFLGIYTRKLLESPFRGSFDLVVRFLLGRVSVIGSMASALAVTDELVLPLRAVGDLAMATGVSWEEMVVITQCASLDGKLPFDDVSVGAVLSVTQKVESFGDQFAAEINRVLQAGGIVLVQSFTPSSDQKIRAKKPAWSMGSSSPLKKAIKALPKTEIDDDELIDEHSLLTDDDLKKPQLPVGDCEVGATKKARKACKNCSCGRTEAEQKVEKLGLTAKQIDNPVSACGSVREHPIFSNNIMPFFKATASAEAGLKIFINGQVPPPTASP